MEQLIVFHQASFEHHLTRRNRVKLSQPLMHTDVMRMFNIDATFYTNADFKLVWFWEMLGNCHHLFTCENLSDDEYLDLLFTGALIKYPDHDRFLFSHYFKKLRYYLIAELDKLKLMYATFDVTARVVFDDKNRKTWYFVEYFIDHRSA